MPSNNAPAKPGDGYFEGLNGALAGFSMGSQVFGSFFGARAARQALQFQMEVARRNAATLDRLAGDAVRRGITAESRQRGRIGQLKASQRARLAANGVVIDQGSALAVQQDTDLLGNIDALTIRENAAREAQGLIRERNNQLYAAAGAQVSAGAQSPFLSGLTSLISEGRELTRDYDAYHRNGN